MTPSSCDCPQPPGGRVSCEDDQIAICTVENGEVVGRCVSLPQSWVTGQMRAWAYSEITGIQVLRDDDLSGSDITMLLSGTFEDYRKGTTVNFVLPERIKELLRRRFE